MTDIHNNNSEDRGSDNFLAQLNSSQREAVVYTNGPQLVIAGAGSGKTRVITYKIAYLLAHGYRPNNILALTFTNKAAGEMKQRISNIVGEELARGLHMGTFHSVFSRILRIEAENIGYFSNFTIYDESDSRSLVKNIIKEKGLDDKIYRPATVSNIISMAKNRLVIPEVYLSSPCVMEHDAANKMPKMGDIYDQYVIRCRQSNAMDFDDLLLYTYQLFHEHEDVRRKYASRFLYILVDEYQDTNFVQQKIVNQLACENLRICAVGDDAQSIYAFRGANINNILGFNKQYETSKMFKLERNYRSTQLIVQAANSLISHNGRQIPKVIYSKNNQGDKLELIIAVSDREESSIVCKKIKKLIVSEGCGYDSFAILYRTNAQSRIFEEELRRQNIPYKIYGGLSFYQRKEIKDIVAYFRLVGNHDDEEALRRVINYPARGIGNVTVSKISKCARDNSVSMWQIIKHPAQYQLNVSKSVLTKLDAFRLLIEQFASRAKTTDAYVLGREIIIDSGLYNEINLDTTIEGISRQDNLQEFLSGLENFVNDRREENGDKSCSLAAFLQEVSLLTDISGDDDSSSKVSLMTVHAAKGLEFPTVFIVGLEENIFPSPLSVNTSHELEEERRLLYVAITRAEKHCILTYARTRFRYGRQEFDAPSRFIKDIDSSLISFGGGEYGHDCIDIARYTTVSSYNTFNSQTNRTTSKMPSVFVDIGKTIRPSGIKTETHLTNNVNKQFKKIDIVENGKSSNEKAIDICVGSWIEHQRFGKGRVVAIEGMGENTKATVEFVNTGRKQLLLKFAVYKVIK